MRMAGGGASYLDAIKSLYRNLDKIGWGPASFALAAIVIALLGISLTLVKLCSARSGTPALPAILLLLASIGVIGLWYALFKSHTADHGGFMVRLLVWPMAVGPYCCFLALQPGARGNLVQRPEG